jgi:pyruvate/2-oxoglutarate dehydrogenase complex dihydrolipoamide acyltransferase (E2) component
VQTKVKMPRVGENVNSVFVVDIKVQPGSEISIGDTLISVETDKATVDIESPVAGRVIELLVKLDDEIQPGMPYVIVETS